MIVFSNDRLQFATISSPRKEPKVSTFWRGGGNRRLELVEVAEDGVGVERVGSVVWDVTRDTGGAFTAPWGEAVAARCRGDDSPPATTKQNKGSGQHHHTIYKNKSFAI